MDNASRFFSRLIRRFGGDSDRDPLEWFRLNNRPAKDLAELENVRAQLVKEVASAPEHSPLRARLAGHAAIIAHRRGTRPELEVRNSLEAVHQIDEIVRAGHFALAKSLIESHAAKWPKSDPLRRLSHLLNGPGEGDGFDDQGDDFQIWRRPGGAVVTLVVFAGFGQRFGINLGLLHHVWLSALPANVIYLRDFKRSFYLAGIRSIGNLDATLERLSETLASLGTKKSIFLGQSGGVFGALYYAVRINADMALCFSGRTDLSAPGSPTYERLKAAHESGLIPWPNLQEMIGASAVQVHCYYGAESAVDADQAEKLAGLRNVALYAIEGCDKHSVLDYLAERGELAKIFSSCCEV
jgi:hypothetical protein